MGGHLVFCYGYTSTMVQSSRQLVNGTSAVHCGHKTELFIGDPDDHEGTARRSHSFQIATVHGCQISSIVVHIPSPRLSNVAQTGSYEPGAKFK
jgi:hypothetical protein